MSTILSTPGSAHPGAVVLVADGIIPAATGDLPFSVLAGGTGTTDGVADNASRAA